MADTLGLLQIETLLTPLVIPMILDRAQIGHPTPGNRDKAGVRIRYLTHDVVLTTDQYELLRVEVLQYIQDRFGSDPFLMLTLGKWEVEKLIKSRLRVVFVDA